MGANVHKMPKTSVVAIPEAELAERKNSDPSTQRPVSSTSDKEIKTVLCKRVGSVGEVRVLSPPTPQSPTPQAPPSTSISRPLTQLSPAQMKQLANPVGQDDAALQPFAELLAAFESKPMRIPNKTGGPKANAFSVEEDKLLMAYMLISRSNMKQAGGTALWKAAAITRLRHMNRTGNALRNRARKLIEQKTLASLITKDQQAQLCASVDNGKKKTRKKKK